MAGGWRRDIWGEDDLGVTSREGKARTRGGGEGGGDEEGQVNTPQVSEEGKGVERERMNPTGTLYQTCYLYKETPV